MGNLSRTNLWDGTTDTKGMGRFIGAATFFLIRGDGKQETNSQFQTKLCFVVSVERNVHNQERF